MEPSEQAPSTPPPKRRRRRWLIVAFLLVLVSMVSWWYWPRGDARFVGKWSMSDDPDITLTLSSNGLAHFSTADLVINDTWLWRSDGKYLIIGDESEGLLTQAVRAASMWVSDITSHYFAYGQGEDRYRVDSVSAEEVQLQRLGEDQKAVVLRRIPE